MGFRASVGDKPVAREKEEQSDQVPGQKGGSRVNFLSVKTPLEREKCRCLLLVILVGGKTASWRGLSGAEISIDPGGW